MRNRPGAAVGSADGINLRTNGMRSSCKWMAGIVLAAVGGLVQAAENPVGPGVPRYQVYAPPESLSGNTGEPSIGYNTFTKKAFVLSGLRTLWATFPQDQTPKMPLACDAQYVDRSFVTTGITTLDPIGITDSLIRGKETRRTWIGQLAGKAHITAYTDDDGMTWTQTEGNAPVVTGFDHQGIGVGPYPTTGIGASIPHPTYANAFYYCGQDIAYANCTRSDDGGLTFKPPTYMYTQVSTEARVLPANADEAGEDLGRVSARCACAANGPLRWRRALCRAQGE